MIKCSLCDRQTKKGEPTGHFLTIVYKNPEKKELGKRIYKSIKVCMEHSGECLLK